MIIGGGPAGLTAATYLARFRRLVVVIDAGFSRARWIPSSHNCPGFPFGVAGNELLGRFRAQAGAYGVPIVRSHIERLSFEDSQFSACGGANTWHAKAVILATGVIDRLPQIHGIENAIGAGTVRLCAVCDGYEARDETIGVYGSADIAIGHAEFLRTFSEKVAIIEIGVRSVNEIPLKERARERGIRWIPASSQLSVTGTACQVQVEGKSVHFDTVYPVLGMDPQSGLGVGLGAESDDVGNLIVNEDMRTTVGGLYAIGDVVVGLNQISVAVGQAAVAATAVHGILPYNPK